MSYKQPGFLKQIWWTIKWAFTRNKRVETPSVAEPRFTNPPMDLRLSHEEEVSDA